MIPSILCYESPSVRPLGLKIPRFQSQTHDPQFSNQIDASVRAHALRMVLNECVLWVVLHLALPYLALRQFALSYRNLPFLALIRLTCT